MTYEQEQLERAKAGLKEVLNKVPQRVINGDVMQTRAWLQLHEEATKLLKKRGVSSAELMGMTDRLK